MAIYCSQGHTNPDDATFCDECGEPLPVATAASAPNQDDDAPTLPAGGAPPAPAEEAPTPMNLDVAQPAPAADFEATQAAPDAPVIPPPTEEADTVTAVPSAPEVIPAFPAMVPPPDLPAPPAAPEPEPMAAAPSAPEAVPAAPSTPEPAPVAAASAPAVPVAAQPRLTVEGTTTTFDLGGKASVVLGREDAPSNSFPDIDLTPFGAEEGGVSRLHARLTHSGSDWNIEDLDSTNFTFINRKRIAPKTPTALADGDEIRLGRVGLRFKTTV
jgi:hypothetical protein